MSKPHGEGGAYVGGDWVDMEDIPRRYMCDGVATSGSKHDRASPRSKCIGCPRSRSRRSAAKPDGSYDVVIVGAGGIGCAIARELAKTKARVLVLEAGDDVTQGATKGNSGIIHAGYDDKPGSVRAKFCPEGCRMFPQLDEELHFGFTRNGSLVIAKNADDEETLQRLASQGNTNGVKNLRIVNQKELREMEPNVHPDSIGALHAGDAGTVIPYEFCIALAENAADNGAEFRIRRQVTAIRDAAAVEGSDATVEVVVKHWEPKEFGHPSTIVEAGGTGTQFTAAVIGVVASLVSATFAYVSDKDVGMAVSVFFFTFGLVAFFAQRMGVSWGRQAAPKTATKPSAPVDFQPSKGTPAKGEAVEEVIRTRYVINAAGCHSDAIAEMVGDKSFQVNPRYGEYVLLKKTEGKRVNATLFPCPGKMGKGVLVQNTLWGNLILGPTARDSLMADPSGSGKLVPNPATENESKDAIVKSIMAKCRALLPDFNAKEVIHTFMGARAKTTRGDWIIEQCPTHKRVIHAAGIDSPGLAASPAIAVEVVRLLVAAGCESASQKNTAFVATRAPIVIPKKGLKDAFGNALKYAPKPANAAKDPYQNVVCKCEKVTEAEIVEAVRRSLPVDTTQAIRRRTRAGMGHCQGDPDNYCCEDRVAEIVARELNLKPSQIPRRPWPGSSVMPRRFFTEEDREWVDGLSHE